MIDRSLEEIGKRARKAARGLALLSTGKKNAALAAMADALTANSARIETENAKDVSAAQAAGTDAALVDRLALNPKRIAEMADAIRQIIALPDPVGGIYDETVRPNGIKVAKMRIPIGVIGIIYESRPNVTADAASLCIKSGNAVILRGGSEAFHSNMAIASLLSEGLAKAGVDPDAVQVVKTPNREAVMQLLKMDKYIDIIIPRGGNALIRMVTENSLIPVIKHDAGVCHVFVDEGADLEMAKQININSKVQRPGVCNSSETLLVHAAWLKNLPALLDALAEKGVELRGCPRTLGVYPMAKPATEDDWYAEYLDLILAVKVVDSMDEAVEHIEKYGSHHTEAIVTPSENRGWEFVQKVDSSAVMVNASTRFNDGGQLGLGAEMGISTQKLHCRGPMGLHELTTYKYFVLGAGQVRT
ncbi:MAG: glutamate-5-semialdehyde dehydrogenase [Nitrospinae bacterium]|nr:glutamate-5-semialdehyde dehydrogenase [Nitrospinota bacterium]